MLFSETDLNPTQTAGDKKKHQHSEDVHTALSFSNHSSKDGIPIPISVTVPIIYIFLLW